MNELHKNVLHWHLNRKRYAPMVAPMCIAVNKATFLHTIFNPRLVSFKKKQLTFSIFGLFCRLKNLFQYNQSSTNYHNILWNFPANLAPPVIFSSSISSNQIFQTSLKQSSKPAWSKNRTNRAVIFSLTLFFLIPKKAFSLNKQFFRLTVQRCGKSSIYVRMYLIISKHENKQLFEPLFQWKGIRARHEYQSNIAIIVLGKASEALFFTTACSSKFFVFQV